MAEVLRDIDRGQGKTNRPMTNQHQQPQLGDVRAPERFHHAKWVTKKQGHTDQSYKKFLPHHTKTTNTTTP
jgi:hypothetical protein